MSNCRFITGSLVSGTAALLCAAAVSAAESTYCVAVDGGFGKGGTTYIGRGFAVPAAGNCTPWSGFTKTGSSVILTTTGTGCLSSDGKVLTLSLLSTDPAYLGPGQLASDYIALCPKGASGCPVGAGTDQGAFAGTALPETCTTALENLPSKHD
jgi:hypothetical protein